MKFNKATFKNFRLLRDLELDFSSDPEKTLTVIRAENETGKTTVLNALQWVLFGEEGLPHRGVGYRIHPIDWDFRTSREVDIEVSLQFEHTYARSHDGTDSDQSAESYWARRAATVTVRGPEDWSLPHDESFELLKHGDGGYVKVEPAELRLKQMLGSNVKDLFFTDGDRALSFISSEARVGEKRKLVQKAIRDMLGFELLDSAREHVKKAMSQSRGQVKEFPGSEALAQINEIIDQAQEKDTEAAKRLGEIESELAGLAADISTAREKIDRALEKGNREELSKQEKGLEQQLAAARQRKTDLVREHSGLFRSDSLGQLFLKDHIENTRKMLDDLKRKGRIPRTAIPILEERLEMGECICGESLGHDSEEASRRCKHIEDLISEQKAGSETDDRLTELRLLANNISEQLSAKDSDWSRQVKALIARRSASDKEISRLEAEVKALEARVDALNDQDISAQKTLLSTYQETRERLVKEQSVLQHDRTRLAQVLVQRESDLRDLTRKKKQYGELQARLTATQDILDVLVASYKGIEEVELPRVSKIMNDYFLTMIEGDPKSSIIRKAEVTPDYDITVYGPSNSRLDTDVDLNGASKRALTLSFVLALAEVSGFEAPNVIDTPLGTISGTIKRNVLQTTVKHSTQLVLLLTRAEIRDCENIIDHFAGKVYTLTSSAHFPRQLRYDPKAPYFKAFRCECNHRQYCHACERTMDSEDPLLSRRK